tara:strand:+ start:192 stop:479 length:288 start_codon:yes stop_codon:yes gene_type:complete
LGIKWITGSGVMPTNYGITSCQLGGGMNICVKKHTRNIWRVNLMSDIKETLLNAYEEGLDMGMTEYEAECFAYESLDKAKYPCDYVKAVELLDLC